MPMTQQIKTEVGLPHRQRDFNRLIAVFLAWKSLLILLAVLTPGPGYDTSGFIVLAENEQSRSQIHPPSISDRLALSHLRWDALYFVKAAQRGYLYEQEWAFSRAHSWTLGTVKDWLWGSGDIPLKDYVFAGILVSNLAHLFSVLVLYRLARIILSPQHNPNIPFTAAVLHVFSPAGLFLSAPYAESLFSAVNFTGIACYVLARETATASGVWTRTQDAYMLFSGLAFAGATLIRSNGLLNGLIFLYDVVHVLPRVLAFQLDVHGARRIVVTCVAGAILSFGYIVPQFTAYEEYCKHVSHGARPWCDNLIPSIYSWVQSHYWHVGFLRYWNLPNLPLFLMAAPMIWLLSSTSVIVLRGRLPSSTLEHPLHPSRPASLQKKELGFGNVPQVAIPQLVLTVAASTNFHVQIINRISSGYPIWYLVVATWIVDRGTAPGGGKEGLFPQWIVRWMVIYGFLQGLLFAGFLPPA